MTRVQHEYNHDQHHEYKQQHKPYPQHKHEQHKQPRDQYKQHNPHQYKPHQYKRLYTAKVGIANYANVPQKARRNASVPF